MNEKNFLGKVVYYASYPLLVVGAAKITSMCTSNAFASFIAASMAMLLYVCAITSTKDKWFNITSRQIQIVVTTFAFVAVFLRYLSDLSFGLNPWGQIGWVSLIGVSVVVIVLIFLFLDKDEEIKDRVHHSLRILNMVFAVSGIYLLFGNLLIWVLLISYVLQAWFIMSRLERFDITKNNHMRISAIAAGVIGVASTIFQFWFTQIVFGIQLWKVLLGLVILVAVYFLISYVADYIETKKMTREARLKEEAERPEREREAKELQVREAQQVEERKKIANEAFTALKKAEKPTWNDIFYITNNGFREMSAIPHVVIANANLVELIEVSDIKSKIKWGHYEFEVALKALTAVANNSYDDEVLQKIIEQVKALEKFSSYNGYSALRTIIKNEYRMLLELVNLKEEDKSTVALVKNK